MKSNRNGFKHISYKKLRFPFLIIFVLFQLFIAINAKAGYPRVSAKNPFVFSDAAINAVVLQYIYVGTDSERLSGTGDRLSLLIHQSILHSILKFRSVGAVQIVLDGNKEENKPEVIFDKILGIKPGAKSTIRKNHILVFLWGYIYEEGDAIYVQSYIRFLRHGVNETISIPLASNLNRKFTLKGRLPSQTFAFAPRRLTVQDLNRIDSEFKRNILVRGKPEITAPGYPLTEVPGQDKGLGAYYVVDARAGWMEIVPHEGGIGGWIRTDVSLGSADLKSHMPELHFVEAVAGYLSYQMAFPGKIQPEWIHKAIDNYLERETSTRRANNAVALADVIAANLLIQSASYRDRRNIDMIIKFYSNAVSLIPYNADALNLKTCANIRKGHLNRWDLRHLMEFADEFHNILSLDPGNSLVLSNLETFYSYLASLPDSEEFISKRELTDKLEVVKQILTGIKKKKINSPAPAKE